MTRISALQQQSTLTLPDNSESRVRKGTRQAHNSLPRGGLIVSTALGFIGAVLGPWLATQLKLSEPLVVNIGGHPFGILWSIIGAAVFVAIIHLVSRR